METVNQIFKAYNRFPIVFDHGQGMYLYDSEGKEYLDFGSGIGVMAFGYADLEFNNALKDQVDKITHTSNLFYHKPLIEASKKVVALSKMHSVFFTNSGAEANEGAIKCAKKYRYKKGKPGSEIIAMNHSFHGRTLGALSVTGNEAYRDPFYPLVEKVLFAEYNSLSSVESLVSENTMAIILEPIQGEGGIIPATEEFLKGVRSICDKNDIVLIFDEVQCGFYRSGYPFVWQKYDVMPDIMTLAKALSAGIPAGAFVTNENLSLNSLEPGDHGTTCGGNPLAMAAVCASLDIMEKRNLGEHVRETALYLDKTLQRFVDKYDFCLSLRGEGFMRGVEISEKVKVGDILNKSLEKGLVVLSAHGNVLRLLPPLIATKENIDKMENILDSVFSDL